MIDRLGSISVSVGRLDRTGRGSERPGRGGDFQDLLRGASEQTDADTAARSPLRVSRIGGRTREAGQPQPQPIPGTASAPRETAAPGSAPRTRLSTSGASGSTPAAVAPEQSGGSAATSNPTATTTSGTRFVRSTDSQAPQFVRFAQVPESAQYPLGPYRQAPAEFGGEWWVVNPFTGPEPWRALEIASAAATAALETPPAAEDFVRIFGPRPETRTDAAQWDQDLSYFQGSGLPEGFNEAQLEAATAEFEAWGLGEPVFYQGRYGWQVRFPDSQLPMFETTASTALLVPHLVIAEHQVRAIQEGVTPARYHPWLPERLQA
jgi:hypothetical protein